MKRILGLAALLGHALSAASGIEPFKVKPGGRGANKRPYSPVTRPTNARWWHDPSDDNQRTTFESAAYKRQRRAEKLKAQTLGAWNNPAHTARLAIPGGGTQKAFIARLNPFYQSPVSE